MGYLKKILAFSHSSAASLALYLVDTTSTCLWMLFIRLLSHNDVTKKLNETRDPPRWLTTEFESKYDLIGFLFEFITSVWLFTCCTKCYSNNSKELKMLNKLYQIRLVIKLSVYWSDKSIKWHSIDLADQISAGPYNSRVIFVNLEFHYRLMENGGCPSSSARHPEKKAKIRWHRCLSW